jgi:hypothetical protein
MGLLNSNPDSLPFLFLIPITSDYTTNTSSSSYPKILPWSYLGYRKDQKNDKLPVFTETMMAIVCLFQSVLLGTFAAILGAHRSEILEKQEENASRLVDDTYQTPYERS